MSEFDHIFENQAPRQTPGGKPFDKEAWGKMKQEERKEVYFWADTAAQEVASDPGKFREYLDLQARFERYSATNALLIFHQMPNATRVMDFYSWKDRGASIKRHSEGISILEPGGAYERDDSSIATSWNVKKVFDISQTTARAKRADAPKVDDRLLLKALINNPPVPLRMVDELPGNAVATYDHDQQAIFVRRNMTAPNLFRSVSLALARAEIAAASKNYDPEQAAFTSYCASYILGKKYGMDVSGYDFTKAPGAFGELDAKEIRAVLSEIRDTAHEISSRMYRVLEQAREQEAKDKAAER